MCSYFRSYLCVSMGGPWVVKKKKIKNVDVSLHILLASDGKSTNYLFCGSFKAQIIPQLATILRSPIKVTCTSLQSDALVQTSACLALL